MPATRQDGRKGSFGFSPLFAKDLVRPFFPYWHVSGRRRRRQIVGMLVLCPPPPSPSEVFSAAAEPLRTSSPPFLWSRTEGGGTFRAKITLCPHFQHFFASIHNLHSCRGLRNSQKKATTFWQSGGMKTCFTVANIRHHMAFRPYFLLLLEKRISVGGEGALHYCQSESTVPFLHSLSPKGGGVL